MGFAVNSNQDLFIFNFPSDFVPLAVNEKYQPHLKNYHKPFATILDYLNSEIKEINLPGLTAPTVEQTKFYGKKRAFRGSISPYDTYTREFTGVMRDVDSITNYWMIQDLYLNHYIKVGKPFLDPFVVTTLDTQDREQFKLYFREVLFKGTSDLVLANERKEGEQKTFTLSFAFNYLDIEYIPRFGQDLADGSLIEPYFDQLKKNDE